MVRSEFIAWACMSYYLGIDGGGTKTTCAVGDEGRLLATATAGPSNIVRVGETLARESLLQSVRQACVAAGIAPEQVCRTCVGGSGAGRPELAATVRRFMVEILSSPIDVVGDMEIALEAAFGAGPGVIIIAGTGSIAYGRNQQGATARAGGWGFAIGDEGSAHWIAREVVRNLLRGADEKPQTEAAQASALVTSLVKAWNVNSLLELARVANSVPPPDFAALFPAIVSSADDCAVAVLNSAGRELARIAAIVSRRLFATQTSEPVHMATTGSVFRYAPAVRHVFYNEIRNLEPRVAFLNECVEPVQGALSMARRAGVASHSR